ncbi:MAG: HD domain-containing protein, partial [Flavobacteriales bacterium]|nr:HD domain-containing protein [Flavobacteriales bacterium]
MKRKYTKLSVINDPIYGFISIPNQLLFELIDHPYFQRLRRISQLGLTHMVFPGSNHTRFQHAIGAMHLMTQALDVLKMKGVEITSEEEEAAKFAILLHDIGHGPYSHTLEHTLVKGVPHERLSELFMDRLNQDFNGKLTLAIQIFRDDYPKKFLHQLVSSQLDMDRMDYLKRDSFYTGVSEGIINTDRLLSKLNVCDNLLAVEYKGIYSVEQFIIARRLMYWQVYLHKTCVSADHMLMKTLQRAKEIAKTGRSIHCTPSLELFLYNDFTVNDFLQNDKLLDSFAALDDFDIMSAIKTWCLDKDKTLAHLSKCLVNRNLYKTRIQDSTFEQGEIDQLRDQAHKIFDIDQSEVDYYIFIGRLTNHA